MSFLINKSIDKIFVNMNRFSHDRLNQFQINWINLAVEVDNEMIRIRHLSIDLTNVLIDKSIDI